MRVILKKWQTAINNFWKTLKKSSKKNATISTAIKQIRQSHTAETFAFLLYFLLQKMSHLSLLSHLSLNKISNT
ncbi:MAG: hypothetical protein LBP59_06185 [Planctomycetaceae bacterium]|nr:hypothetical protein [Planctomycetaceae bacterium]